jgi:hypothetical protein
MDIHNIDYLKEEMKKDEEWKNSNS